MSNVKGYDTRVDRTTISKKRRTSTKSLSGVPLSLLLSGVQVSNSLRATPDERLNRIVGLYKRREHMSELITMSGTG